MARKKKINFVTVKNKGYGKKLKGVKIYYEGKKPKHLKKDGSIYFGKNILEILVNKFKRFHWIITTDVDSIKKIRGIYRIRTSSQLLNRMNSATFERNRDIKNEIIKVQFAQIFPRYFKRQNIGVYVPGSISRILDGKIITRLSSADKQSIMDFLPSFFASESLSKVNFVTAEAEVKNLKGLAKLFNKSLEETHSETWWQSFIQNNILIIQQGYIKAIGKINVNIGKQKLPDFSLISHDSYLDILEIKTPETELIKHDSGRDNYYWSTDLSKAIIQVENYLENVSNHANDIRSFLLDEHGINLKVLRPRGFILAGDVRAFKNQKEKDDLRLLAQSLKNIQIITYDELLIRLQNYIKVLESFKK